jgi:hypothetical protein
VRRAAIDRLHAKPLFAMRAYRLRPSLCFCAIGARFILLDLEASRYLLLEHEAACHFAAFLGGDPGPDAVAWLTERALIDAGDPAPPEDPPPPANESLFEIDLPAPRVALIAEALAAQLAARWHVGRRSMSALLEPSKGRSPDLERCRPVVAAFRRATRYLQAEDQCLANGIAMRAMLARRGIGSQIVIGVRLPFAAHCWVQSGRTVLSDPLDRIRNFRPIVTVP